MAVFTLNKENFNTEVLESEKVVLVDFWSPRCGPCMRLAPIVEQLSEEREDVKIGKINVDEEQELAVEYGVMSIPTLIVFKNGEAVTTEVGARPKEALEKLLEI